MKLIPPTMNASDLHLDQLSNIDIPEQMYTPRIITKIKLLATPYFFNRGYLSIFSLIFFRNLTARLEESPTNPSIPITNIAKPVHGRIVNEKEIIGFIPRPIPTLIAKYSRTGVAARFANPAAVWSGSKNKIKIIGITNVNKMNPDNQEIRSVYLDFLLFNFTSGGMI
jgi:hypothetical protein